MGQVVGVLIGFLILGLMLAIHELGHYIAGRKLGFTVEEFSIFMGPRLLSWERNGIKYTLKLIPIGASVQFAGEYPEHDVPDSELRKGDFYERPRWARAITLLAGPLMNIVTAVIVFGLLYASVGFATTSVGQVAPDSLAATAGVVPGDRIVEIADYKVKTDLDMNIGLISHDAQLPYDLKVISASSDTVKTYAIQPATRVQYMLGVTFASEDGQPVIYEIDSALNPAASAFVLGDRILTVEGQPVTEDNFVTSVQQHATGVPIQFTVFRGSAETAISVTPVPVDTAVPLGISLAPNESALEAIPYTFSYIWSYTKGTGRVLGQVFQGRIAAKDSLTGPIGIVDMLSGVVTSERDAGVKFAQLFSMFGMVSLALGTANLLPIAPLDGGQLLLLGIESVRRKRLSVKAQSIITLAGVLFVLALALLSLSFDIGRIIGR